MEIVLKKLDLGKKVKCVCEDCKGTGIYKGYNEHDDLGVICQCCNGKGYNVLNINKNIQLFKDENSGIVYIVKDGIIYEWITLFDKLQRRDDVNYVMYGTGRFFSPKYLFEHGASEVEVIRYSDFLKGKLPLPMMEYTCPRLISQKYGKGNFDNDCLVYNCGKFGTSECWEKFYGDAKTVEEKQKVMKRCRF